MSHNKRSTFRKKQNSELLRELPIISPYPLQPTVINHYQPIEHIRPPKQNRGRTSRLRLPSPLPKFFSPAMRCWRTEWWFAGLEPQSSRTVLECLGTCLILKIGFVAVHLCVYLCIDILYIYYMRVHLQLPYPKKHALLQSFRNLVWMEQNLLTLVYVHPSSESSYGWIWMTAINPR